MWKKMLLQSRKLNIFFWQPYILNKSLKLNIVCMHRFFPIHDPKKMVSNSWCDVCCPGSKKATVKWLSASLTVSDNGIFERNIRAFKRTISRPSTTISGWDIMLFLWVPLRPRNIVGWSVKKKRSLFRKILFSPFPKKMLRREVLRIVHKRSKSCIWGRSKQNTLFSPHVAET